MTSTFHKPSKVERARDRLDSAVQRLEQALQTVKPQSGKDAHMRLREMSAEVEKLKSENDELREVNRVASERLASTIDRFKKEIGA